MLSLRGSGGLGPEDVRNISVGITHFKSETWVFLAEMTFLPDVLDVLTFWNDVQENRIFSSSCGALVGQSCLLSVAPSFASHSTFPAEASDLWDCLEGQR